MKDPRTIDINHPEFHQIHFLRFERGNRVSIEGSLYSLHWMEAKTSL